VDKNNSEFPLRETSDQNTRAAQTQVGELVPTFEEIYHEYAERTLNLLYRFTSREPVARDLLQDVFIKVYENMGTFERRSQIYTWIYRIAVNHAINYMRRERRTLWFNLLDETVVDLLKQEKVEISGLGGGDVLRPDEVLERSEADELVRRAVDSLPVKYKVPFVLFKDEHMGYTEIANVLEISLSAVESRIHRARKMLIKKLSPLFK
jgi:RNA polymerase sigma-70 factor (ECF subfamily)